METHVWTEPSGPILKEALRQEARRWHQMHQPPVRLADWKARRAALRQRLLEAAGVVNEPCALDLREQGTLRRDGYRISKLTFQSRPGWRVTANLYTPDGPGPFPAVLNVHGHYLQGKIAPLVAARGHLLAQEGFVVLSVDAIGAGERGTRPGEFDPHAPPGVPILSVGETLLGMQLHDNRRGLDLLQSLPYVDGQRLGVTGASGGGNQTMWLAALDPRVKAAVPVVSVGTFEAYVTNGNCWCETLPDGLRITEEWGVLGLIAPNPLLILTAMREEIPAFVPKEMLRTYAEARKVYALYGAEEKIACQILDLPHGYFPEMRRHMLGWFKHWFQGEGSALPRALRRDPDLPETALLCFPGKNRPRDVKSLLQCVSRRTQAAKQEFLRQGRLSRRQKAAELQRLLKVPPGPALVRCGAVVAGETDGRRWTKFAVESEPGVLIPCTLLWPAQPASAVVIAVHPDGKAAGLEQPAARETLAQGRALCLADLRDIGECRWSPADDQTCLLAARTALWLGRTMLGDWVKDLQAIRAALQTIGAPKRVELLGFGQAGTPGTGDPQARARGAQFGNGDTALAALAAAVLEPRFAGVTVVDLLASYVVKGVLPVQRYSIYVPGLLRWGDVSLLAAMAGRRARVRSLVHPSGRRLSARERAAWFGEVRRLGKRF
jgi:hypothetical protein